jgi:hypothetical protein
MSPKEFSEPSRRGKNVRFVRVAGAVVLSFVAGLALSLYAWPKTSEDQLGAVAYAWENAKRARSEQAPERVEAFLRMARRASKDSRPELYSSSLIVGQAMLADLLRARGQVDASRAASNAAQEHCRRAQWIDCSSEALLKLGRITARGGEP